MHYPKRLKNQLCKIDSSRGAMNQERYGLRVELPLQLKGMRSHGFCWRTALSFWNGLVWYLDPLGVKHWSFFLDLMVANANHQEFLFMFKDFVGESFNLCGLLYPFIKWTQWKEYTHTHRCLRSHIRQKAVSGFAAVLIFWFKPKFSEMNRLSWPLWNA